MMLLAYAGAAGTMSSHGHGKSLKLIAIYFITRKEYAIILLITPSNRNIFTWIVRRAFNAIYLKEIKLKLNLLFKFLRNRKLLLKTSILKDTN